MENTATVATPIPIRLGANETTSSEVVEKYVTLAGWKAPRRRWTSSFDARSVATPRRARRCGHAVARISLDVRFAPVDAGSLPMISVDPDKRAAVHVLRPLSSCVPLRLVASASIREG